MKHLAQRIPPKSLPHRASPPFAQRGIATVLTITLVGMALTASVLGTAYYIHGRQGQSMTTHAQTQAQLNAWTGAHVLQNYLDALHSKGDLQRFMALPTTPPVQLELTGAGVNGLVNAQITQFNLQATPPTVVAKITGHTAQGTRAQSSALLEVVYEIHAASAPTCQPQLPGASVLIRGGLNITGGESGFESADGLLDIIVDGSMTINNASQASFSGCAKGDININGGGVKPGGKIYSETGTVTLHSMTAPVDADVWGNKVTMENFGAGTFRSIHAGSYKVNFVDASGSVQALNAFMGGKLLADTAEGGPNLAKGALPWRKGTLVPLSQGQVVLYKNDQAQWLLDLKKVSIDSSTGKLSRIQQAAQALAADATPLPDVLYAHAKDVDGGAINLYVHTAQELWGYNIEIKGWNGSHTSVKAAGNFKTLPSKLGDVIGGGDFIATQNTSDIKFNSATIAGTLRDNNGNTITNAATIFPQLRQNSPNTSPGLPGRPYCDAQMEALDIDLYKKEANYVFEYVKDSEGKKVSQVTIQGVKNRSTGRSIDGVYKLGDPVVKTLMSCNWQDTVSCEQSVNQITKGSWDFTGMKHFPVGIAWFDGDVSFTPAFKGMHNTILSKGTVELGNGTSETNKLLKAPSHAGLEAMCKTPSYIPTVLCQQLDTANAQGTQLIANTSARLSNTAVMAEKDLKSNGWTLHGNLQIGRGLSNSANSSTIYGTVAVGLNGVGQGVNLGSGGLIVKTNQLNNDQLLQPGGGCGNTTGGSAGAGNNGGQGGSGAGVTRMKWSRYL